MKKVKQACTATMGGEIYFDLNQHLILSVISLPEQVAYGDKTSMLLTLTHISLSSFLKDIGKQC